MRAVRIQAVGIKLDQPAIRGKQIGAGARFEKVVDDSVRKYVCHAVVGEAITVKTRNAFVRAKPDEAVRVLFDPVDIVTDQAIGDSIVLYRQLLGVDPIQHQRTYHEPGGKENS